MAREMAKDRSEKQPHITDIPRLIGELFKIVKSLNEIFPERPFTPDGHLVGSIGEVVARYIYGITLEKCSNEGFDAKTKDGRTVEIKLAGKKGKNVSVSSEAEPPDYLIVLKLTEEGFVEIYNGQFPVELWQSKAASKRKIKSLTLNELKPLSRSVLRQENPLEDFNRFFGPTAVALNQNDGQACPDEEN